MSRETDLKSLRISLSGALVGFSVSTLLWCVCSSMHVNPMVPELISDAVVIAALVVIVVRARRVLKS